MTILGDLLEFGQHLKPLATINFLKFPTFLGNFSKGVKIYHFSSEIIFRQLLYTFGDFFWSHWLSDRFQALGQIKANSIFRLWMTRWRVRFKTNVLHRKLFLTFLCLNAASYRQCEPAYLRFSDDRFANMNCQFDAENTNLRGSITVQLTYCLFCVDSAALLMLNEQQFYVFGKIQTSQIGGQLYSDTSPYGKCSLVPYINTKPTYLQHMS